MDLTAGSALRKILEIIALEEARSWVHLALAYEDTRVSTATGDALTRLGAELGLPRPHHRTGGQVAFDLVGTLPPDVPALAPPRGTRLLTANRHDYFTDEPATLTNTGRLATVAVRAFEPGPGHDAAAKEVGGFNPLDPRTDLVRKLSAGGPPLVTVTHTTATDGGGTYWSDSRYRELLLAYPRNLWTPEAVRTVVSLVPGVRQALVHDLYGGLDIDKPIFGSFTFLERLFSQERSLGNPHFFTVLVAPEEGALWDGPGQLAERVAAAIDRVRPVGVAPDIDRAGEVSVGFTCTISVEGLPIPAGRPTPSPPPRRPPSRAGSWTGYGGGSRPWAWASRCATARSSGRPWRNPGWSTPAGSGCAASRPSCPSNPPAPAAVPGTDGRGGRERQPQGGRPTRRRTGGDHNHMSLQPDERPLVASGLESGLAALPPVYAAGAGQRTLPLTGGVLTTATGVLPAPGAPPLHEPVLLLRLRRPLADEAVVVRCRPEGAAEELPVMVFAPFSGPAPAARLPPAVGRSVQGGGEGPPRPAPACHAEVPAEAVRGPELSAQEAAELVEGVLLEGLLARLAILATLEKQRIIRQAREIGACRHAGLAFSGALDSLGRDLAVPRLPGEDDAPYRSRLEIFTSWRLPTRPTVTEALNGPGPDGAPNAGLPSRVGVTARFRVVEEQNPLALATRLVHVGAQGAARRARFHQMLRSLHLLDLDAPVPVELPPGRRRRLDEARQVLANPAQVVRPAGPPAVRHLAPGLAEALARLVRLVRALGDTKPLTLRRAYVEEPDPLHELGLGATLDAFGEQRLTAMASKVGALAQQSTDLGRWPAAWCRGRSPRIRPGAGWRRRAVCRPSTRSARGPCSCLPLPMSGLTVAGPPELAAGGSAVFDARHSGDTRTGGLHVLAAEAVRRAAELFPQRQLGQVPAR